MGYRKRRWDKEREEYTPPTPSVGLKQKCGKK